MLEAAMDTDPKLCARLDALEKRVASLEDTIPKWIEPDYGDNGLQSIVMACTPRALSRWLRDVSLEDKAGAFFGVDRSVLTKLQTGMSRNTWKDLLALWREGREAGGRTAPKRVLLKAYTILSELGELGPGNDAGVIDEMEPTPGGIDPARVEAWRSRNRAEVEERRGRAAEWLDRELGK